MPRSLKNESKGTIGRTLMKAVGAANVSYQPKSTENCKFVHTHNNLAVVNQGKDLRSQVDRGNVEDFLYNIGYDGRNLEAERGSNQRESQVILVNGGLKRQNDIITAATRFNTENNAVLAKMRIPRRPKWHKKMSKEELNQLENTAIIEWRKALGSVEENHPDVQITPYEKNIEVWRQLWRVIERSDIVVQIVDGRDPLFFRCNDLEAYSKELNEKKLNFLLINKSDLLSLELRREWSEYLNANHIDHMFFSALSEQEKIDSQSHVEEKKLLPAEIYSAMELNESDPTNALSSISSSLNTPQIVDRYTLKRILKHLVAQVKKTKTESNSEAPVEKEPVIPAKHFDNEDEELLAQLTETLEQQEFNEATNACSRRNRNAVQVGMVGYPNVGKSSVINTLCNKKLVGVGALPGKTRNYQTHFLSEELVVCDCPGLVFPNAASTRAEMVCNGVLPIDKLKDYISPVDLMCSRIPRVVLEKVYKLHLDVEQPDAHHFLAKYAQAKGYHTGSAQPDLARSAKLVLKDLIGGKLLYVKLPPTSIENSIWQSNKVDFKVENFLAGLGGDTAAVDKSLISHEKPENMEALKVQEEEKKIDEEMKRGLLTTVKSKEEELLIQHLKNAMSAPIYLEEEEIILLVVGKKIKGIKLNKFQKQAIKAAYQTGEKVNLRRFLSVEQIEDSSLF